MTNKKRHISLWISILAWTVTTILILLISFRYLLSTGVAHTFLQNRIESSMEIALQAEVEIKAVGGDTWEFLTIEGLSINSGEFQIVIGKLEFRYVLANLIFGGTEIEYLRIEDVLANVSLDEIINLKNSNNFEEQNQSQKELRLGKVSLNSADFTIRSGKYLPDSSLSISNLVFDGSLKTGVESQLGIEELRFDVEHGQLPQVLKINVDGEVSNQSITLNDLVFSLGKSVLDGAFIADLKSDSINGSITSEKLDLYDLIPIDLLGDELGDIKMELQLEGNLDQFEVSLLVDNPQLQNLKIVTGLAFKEVFSLQSLSVSANYINTSFFTDNTHLTVGPVEMLIQGNISGFNEQTDFNWKADASNIEFDQYRFENILGKGEFSDNSTIGEFKILSDGGEQLQTSFEIESIFTESPDWNIEYFVEHFNPATYNDDFPDGDLHASGTISGNSFSVPDSLIRITLKNQNPQTGNTLPWIIGQDWIDEIEFSIDVSNTKLLTESKLRVSESYLDLEIQAFNPFDETSDYTYQANFRDFDIGSLAMYSGNNSRLTGGLYGIGNGKKLESANIFSTLSVQSGEINGANIESFDATVVYESGTLKIREGNLKSEIADGTITGQRDVMDVTNPENQLNLDLTIKNVQPLAGLVGLEFLQAKGQLMGQIQQDVNGVLLGNFDLNLSNVIVDSIFEASVIQGKSFLQIEEKSQFQANLEIVNPLISEIVFQDILMEMEGVFTEDSLEADFELTIVGSERGQLFQKGLFKKDIKKETADIEFSRFDILSNESNLILQKPFHVHYNKDVIGTDTLTLSSTTGAFLEVAIPYAGEFELRAFANGTDFNLGLIQEIIFGEKFLEGILSGEIYYDQTPTDIVGNGIARIDKLAYKDVDADSLILSFDIINERLDVIGNMYWDSTLAVSSWANVPFVINKAELDDEFYNQPVSGGMEIIPTDLDKFKTLLNEIGIENTTGIISLNGRMSGQAGTPQFNGVFEMNEPTLSGIPVDRLSAEFNYSNPSKRVIIQSEIFSKNTPAAELNIAYPLDINFRTYKLILPNENDEIEIKAVTNNLNIALFNDFVDQNYIASMSGELNADLQFKGPLGHIQPNGYFNLKRGSMKIPYAEIQLKNIAMQLDVDQTELKLTRLYAESGRGQMLVTGSAKLDGIIPSEIVLAVDAGLFEIANTRDLNLVFDVDASITGEVNQPKITGDLILNRGFYYLTNFGEEAIEEVVLDDEKISSFAPFDSLTIDMTFEMRRNFYVRSRNVLDMELEPTGVLEVVKARNEEVELYGTLTFEKGYIRPLGKRFNIDAGQFTFVGDFEDPELDISSSYIPQTRQKGESVELFYLISGTRNQPEFTFKSTPQMEQSDVICYTLFNKPCYSLESWQSVFADGSNTQAFQALTDVLLDQVGNLATRELGVDVVQIDNSGQNGATAIRTGWYLSDRTFFSIINELTNSTPKTLFVLEYLLNENWDLIITQGDDSRQGVDVRYQFDY